MGDCIHIMQVIGDPVGGIRKHVHSIIKGLSPTGFIQSYAYSTTKTDACFRDEIEEIRRHLAGEVPLTVGKKPSIRDIINLVSLIKYVKQNKVDIIHGHGAKGGLYARLVSRLCRIKSVYTPHGGSTHKMFSALEDRLYSAVERWLFSMTDYFLFESRYTADAYHEKVGEISDRWTVNHNGIDPVDIDEVGAKSRFLGYIPNHTEYRIGVFGLLRREKGQIYAIQAVQELIKKGRDVRLHIYGDGPDRVVLERFTRRSLLQDSVLFHGEVTEAEPHMFAMDLVIIPSLFESFGYVALEAMALRKPVVASNVGGLREIIIDKHTGILSMPGDYAALANAIMTYIDNPEKMVKDASAGYQRYAELFTSGRMINTLQATYHALYNNG